MKTDLEIAKERLKNGNLACVLIKGDTIFESSEHGVKPLLECIDSGADYKGFSAADKIVGKAAALLYLLLGVTQIHAQIISRPALELLQNHNIAVTFDTLTENIHNRTNTGLCPIEQSVICIEKPQDAVQIIKDTIKMLMNKK
ncbi:MAG: DUF1893 domain-containing protein [Acutalibacteraceae bacterium]|jgi:hypothetical protein